MDLTQVSKRFWGIPGSKSVKYAPNFLRKSDAFSIETVPWKLAGLGFRDPMGFCTLEYETSENHQLASVGICVLNTNKLKDFFFINWLVMKLLHVSLYLRLEFAMS